jgi:hypothetical protein
VGARSSSMARRSLAATTASPTSTDYDTERALQVSSDFLVQPLADRELVLVGDFREVELVAVVVELAQLASSRITRFAPPFGSIMNTEPSQDPTPPSGHSSLNPAMAPPCVRPSPRSAQSHRPAPHLNAKAPAGKLTRSWCDARPMRFEASGQHDASAPKYRGGSTSTVEIRG